MSSLYATLRYSAFFTDQMDSKSYETTFIWKRTSSPFQRALTRPKRSSDEGVMAKTMRATRAAELSRSRQVLLRSRSAISSSFWCAEASLRSRKCVLRSQGPATHLLHLVFHFFSSISDIYIMIHHFNFVFTLLGPNGTVLTKFWLDLRYSKILFSVIYRIVSMPHMDIIYKIYSGKAFSHAMYYLIHIFRP